MSCNRDVCISQIYDEAKKENYDRHKKDIQRLIDENPEEKGKVLATIKSWVRADIIKNSLERETTEIILTIALALTVAVSAMAQMYMLRTNAVSDAVSGTVLGAILGVVLDLLIYLSPVILLFLIGFGGFRKNYVQKKENVLNPSFDYELILEICRELEKTDS